jgi:hypothetical protein
MGKKSVAVSYEYDILKNVYLYTFESSVRLTNFKLDTGIKPTFNLKDAIMSITGVGGCNKLRYQYQFKSKFGPACITKAKTVNGRYIKLFNVKQQVKDNKTLDTEQNPAKRQKLDEIQILRLRIFYKLRDLFLTTPRDYPTIKQENSKIY